MLDQQLWVAHPATPRGEPVIGLATLSARWHRRRTAYIVQSIPRPSLGDINSLVVGVPSPLTTGQGAVMQLWRSSECNCSAIRQSFPRPSVEQRWEADE
jgi:hypothetical protein